MEQHVGEDFDALVISTTKYGLFVELEKYFVEGLAPIDTLPGDRYVYHENTRKIIGERSRREFSMGDRVHVVLDRVDAIERRLQFSILEATPQRRRKRDRR
jgi:ribonuclease R